MRTSKVAAIAALLVMSCGSSSSEEGVSSPTPRDPETPGDTPPAPPGGPNAPKPGEEPNAPPSIQLVGRFDTRDAEHPKCGWPGCRIVARFEGTSVTVRLAEEALYDGPSEWDVAIDGVWRPKIAMTPGEHDYELARDLPAGAHQVELYKRTESQSGVTQLIGFDFGASGKLLSPPKRAARRIEIVGDSDVSGYGYAGAVDGTDCGGEAWLGRFQNFRAAWGARVGEKLHAELYGTVFSGKGLYYNAWRPDTETFDVLYPRANPEDATSAVDASTLSPDVIVVAVGGNDYNPGQPGDTGPAPLAGFTEKARALYAMLRTKHENAVVFMMAYAALSDAYPEGWQKRTNIVTGLQTVVAERNAAGDAKAFFLAPPPADGSELTGCSGHGGPEYHERIATFVAAEVAKRLGW